MSKVETRRYRSDGSYYRTTIEVNARGTTIIRRDLVKEKFLLQVVLSLSTTLIPKHANDNEEERMKVSSR